MKKNKKKKTIFNTIIALILAELFWGINKPIIKIGLRTVPLPLYLSITILGTALLILPLALSDWRRLQVKEYLILIIGSVISITIGNIALLMGLQRVPAVNASLIGMFGPLLLFILSVKLLKERINSRTLIGVLIAFAGAALIIGKPWDIQGTNNGVAIGNLLILLSVTSGTIGTLVTKTVLKKAGVYQVTFIHLFAGILPIALFSLQYLDALRPTHAGKNGYIAMVCNIIAITLANCLFMYGLKHRKAQEVGVFSYISPVTTIVSAWLILDEKLTIKIAVGALLIFSGIYVTSVNFHKHRTHFNGRYRKAP